MFDFTKYKSFKDTVHGYIQIPMIFVDEIIDTPLFQRLRFVEQTGMRQVYPSARHDRFVHSLGTFYLGNKAVDALLKNFKVTKYWNIYSDDKRELFWAKNKVLFLIACLLHDIGHAPFSHSLEDFYVDDIESDEDGEIALALKKYFPDNIYNEFYKEGTRDIKPQPHEIVSALIVMEKFDENISNVLEKLNAEEFPIGEHTLVSEHAVIPRIIDNSEHDNDMEFIARMITGIAYKDYEPEKQIRNCFISMLNGATFDVDKIDYIIRDSKMSGLNNVELDVERLLNSLFIIPITKCRNYQYGDNSENCDFDYVVLKAKTNSKFNIKHAYILGNLSIKHGKVTIEKDSKIESLIGKMECGSSAEFIASSDVRESGNKIKKNASNLKVLPFLEKKLDVVLKNAKNHTDFEFVSKDGDDVIEIENIFGNIKMDNGDFEISSATKLKGNLQGEFVELEVLGDLLEKQNILPAPEIYNGFQIGFTKQALSVIQNIDVARNYLYLWIYAHHKVVYYANYLIQELVVLAMKVMGCSVKDYISLNAIGNTDDVTIVSLLREAYKKTIDDENKNEQFIALYKEYTTRTYKKSLFKSLADYDLFFIDFTQNEKNRLKGTLIHEGSPGAKQVSYGKIENVSLCKKFGVETLIWVDADLSLKELDPGKTYIYYSENEIHTLDQIKILSVNSLSKRDIPYFYIYYNLSNDKQNINIDNFKDELLDWFKEKVQKST
jgi:HD superfamily phosphohydrolase